MIFSTSFNFNCFDRVTFYSLESDFIGVLWGWSCSKGIQQNTRCYPWLGTVNYHDLMAQSWNSPLALWRNWALDLELITANKVGWLLPPTKAPKRQLIIHHHRYVMNNKLKRHQWFTVVFLKLNHATVLNGDTRDCRSWNREQKTTFWRNTVFFGVSSRLFFAQDLLKEPTRSMFLQDFVFSCSS